MYGDSTSANPIAAALAWLQGSLLGTVATAVAVIAVAWVGFLMLTGRIDIRRAVQVVFGCFILFGASSIAQGIMGARQGFGAEASSADSSPPLAYSAAPPPAYPKATAQPFDPYAGAAVAPRE